MELQSLCERSRENIGSHRMANEIAAAESPRTTGVPTAQERGGVTRPPVDRASGMVVISVIAIVAALQLGRDVFLPLAIAMLITFALSPLVSYTRKFGLPMIAAVLAAVTLAFAVIGIFFLVVAGQIGQLAQQLPTFQGNIVTKLNDLQETGSENGLVARLSRMASTINTEMTSALPAAGAGDGSGEAIAVEVVERRGPFETLQQLALPLISPVAMAGIVIVVVIFMLLERDELRDRFIRLVGANDINRTTQVIEDAGTRVGRYLLIQLLVNVIYAVPIGVGLWLIGVPNALLWGLLTLVLRFVPYIGPILSAIFPLFLAFAVAPGWSTVLWTAALFLTVELISSNVIEPWLYGSRTGVTPLAIIVSAIFWTWVWGPLGLVLSTPLTVCLVVVGRYIPQFEVFDVLFGDRPVLAAHSRLYQRLLVGDTVESTLRAEEILEDQYVSDYHRDVGIPALLLAQADYERGVLSQEQENRFSDAAQQFLGELDPIVEEERTTEEPGTDGDALAEASARLPGEGYHLVVLGGRTRLDDIAGRMLGQAAVAEGARVDNFSHVDLTPSRFNRIAATRANCVILAFLDVAPSRASLLHIRRLKRSSPAMRVGLVICQSSSDDRGTTFARRVSEPKLSEIMAIGADFCATTIDDFLSQAFRDEAPRPVTEPDRKPRRRDNRRAAFAASSAAVLT
jgi:predicted PurR-regulated permease PerM